MDACRVTARGRLVAISAAVLAGCAPLHGWHGHTTSTPSAPFDFAALAPEPVATLRVITPAGLEGFGPALSHALSSALADAAPALREIPTVDTVNALNDHGLATEYGELIAGFARSGILDRKRLRTVGTAVGARYVLLPGLVTFSEILADRFEAVGLKVVRNRVTTLRLWLELWDAHTGRLMWESSGEVSVVSALLTATRTVPFDGIARKLWRRMLLDAAGKRRRILQ
jgi:hypothetical protein